MRVINIILITMVLGLTFSCEDQRASYKLPDKVEHPKTGKLICLAPEAFMDSLNSLPTSTDAAEIIPIYLKDIAPEEPSYLVPIPRMVTISVADMYYVADTLSKDRPLYLVSVYGTIAKRMARELIKRGFDCYCLDGGTYRLQQYINEKSLPLPTKTNSSSTLKK